MPETPSPESTLKSLDTQALLKLHEFQQTTYWQTAEFAAKGMAFYLGITAVLLGYVLTQKLTPPLPTRLIQAALATSFAFFAALAACGWQLRHQLNSLEKTTRSISEWAFEEAGIGHMFCRWRRTLGVVVGAYCVIGVVILLGMIYLLVWMQRHP